MADTKGEQTRGPRSCARGRLAAWDQSAPTRHGGCPRCARESHRAPLDGLPAQSPAVWWTDYEEQDEPTVQITSTTTTSTDVPPRLTPRDWRPDACTLLLHST